MKRRTRNYAKRQLSWMRKLGGVRVIDVTGRDPDERGPRDPRLPGRLMSMRFEKWQALGNDYLIVERDELPFELTPARMRRLCEGHFGVGADGVLLLSRAANPAHVADLRIFNPDGSEAELSGNGAREAIMYLRRRGWTEQDEFAIDTVAGEIRPTITGRGHVQGRHGQGEPHLEGFPRRAAGRAGELVRGRTRVDAFSTSRSATRSARSRSRSWTELEALDLAAIGPAIEGARAVPEPHERVLVHRGPCAASRDVRIRARIFERGVGETLSSGTGASGRGGRARPSDVGAATMRHGTASRCVLDGGELRGRGGGGPAACNLTGWARPVFDGPLSDDFVKELHEAE